MVKVIRAPGSYNGGLLEETMKALLLKDIDKYYVDRGEDAVSPPPPGGIDPNEYNKFVLGPYVQELYGLPINQSKSFQRERAVVLSHYQHKTSSSSSAADKRKQVTSKSVSSKKLKVSETSSSSSSSPYSSDNDDDFNDDNEYDDKILMSKASVLPAATTSAAATVSAAAATATATATTKYLFLNKNHKRVSEAIAALDNVSNVTDEELHKPDNHNFFDKTILKYYSTGSATHCNCSNLRKVNGKYINCNSNPTGHQTSRICLECTYRCLGGAPVSVCKRCLNSHKELSSEHYAVIIDRHHSLRVKK